MILRETGVAGAFILELEPKRDVRGFFARSFCAEEFTKFGLPAAIAQESISANTTKGTLRGLHYQAAPGKETKIVRCARGSIFDVVVDLRPESPTFRKWISLELNDENHHALFIPAGCAHGFQTLADQSDVYYAMSEPFAADLARGLRWNDPAFGIEWPLKTPILSEADRAWPIFQEVFA